MILLSVFIFLGGVFFGCTTLAQDDGCIIGEQSFLRGESFGNAFPTRCGDTDEWPCFCNPDLPESAECPYCSFSAGDGTLYCAKDGQNITFPDGTISRSCTCEIPDDPTESPIRECIVVEASVGCNWFDLNGEPVYFEDGASFGDSIDGACGPAAEWPSFCYVPPGSSGGDDFVIGYPYCVFSDTESGDDLCSRDGETVEYTSTNGTVLSCSCTASGNGATSVCEQVGSSPTVPPDPSSPSEPPDEPSTAPPDDAPSPEVTPAPVQPPTRSGCLSRKYHSTRTSQYLTLALFALSIYRAAI